MPDLTAKLKLEKPKGNETVTRAAYNRNLDFIDQNAAAQSQVDEPFNLITAVYDAGGNKIDITFGAGRATFWDVLVAKTDNSFYSITAPQSNTSYYVYIKSDGAFTHNTSGGAVSGAALIWKVATGSPVSYISTEDRRGRLSGADAQALLDYVNAKLSAQDPLGIPKPCFRADLPPFHLWCDGKTIGDALSGATARANADIHDLFVVLWSTTGLNIYESTGALSARGATAEADWAAHKRLALPKINGRTLIGCDNLGGASADVVTNANADILGGTGGEENHTLTINGMPSHRHYEFTNQIPSDNTGITVTNNFCTVGIITGGDYSYKIYPTSTPADCGYSGDTGGGQPHNNMQPWVSCNWIMRY